MTAALEGDSATTAKAILTPRFLSVKATLAERNGKREGTNQASAL